MEFNVFDFDNTIYSGDSTMDFYLFCLTRQPQIAKCLPMQIFHAGKHLFGIDSKLLFKTIFFSFLKHLRNTDELVMEFWDVNRTKIKDFYYEFRSECDVVVSASPQFLLKLICSQMGVYALIASNVDIKTGVFYGENCYGEEKTRRFASIFPDGKINNFYSDSLSDLPMAMCAKHDFLVKKNGDSRKLSWFFQMCVI
jgi:phosphoserine phosphatase